MNTITLRLQKIDPVKWGIITGAVYALISLIIIVPIFLILSAVGLSGEMESAGLGFLGSGIMMLFLPIFYGVIGFLFGLLGALILNFVLKKVKGLDVDFEKVGLGVSKTENETI